MFLDTYRLELAYSQAAGTPIDVSLDRTSSSGEVRLSRSFVRLQVARENEVTHQLPDVKTASVPRGVPTEGRLGMIFWRSLMRKNKTEHFIDDY